MVPLSLVDKFLLVLCGGWLVGEEQMGDGNNKTHDSCNDDGMRKRLMNRNYYPHYVNGSSYIVVGALLLVLPLPVVIAELFCRFFKSSSVSRGGLQQGW